ncbi:CopG family transcriptional regulator [Halonotius terrestris]|uniref:CopG family transcriptional regulator n=1 Tax=Halonotius terrestris TaxID=2487750 RepID=A0A8J8P9V7_9EURY|nr:zinc ribbon domain-containing protein [Halonotius terrestris]TQQ83698.1 CopG family transcriptional regulator [Halonotius terrestris]
MSKITFRADDDLVGRLEAFDASKSEVMREALRQYLDGTERETTAQTTDAPTHTSDAESIDDLIDERIDRIVAERVDSALAARRETADTGTDVSVNITLDGVDEGASVTEQTVERKTNAVETDPQPEPTDADASAHSCGQCGEDVDSEHVYCPNCGEKATRRLFCDCGDELRSDWAFCPGCGRRTPAADVLDKQ